MGCWPDRTDEHGGVSTPHRPDPPSAGTPSSDGVLDAVPRRLPPHAARIFGTRIGAPLLHIAGELVRVQIFDRAMTLAAQAFTSVFPILIMLGALFGARVRSWFVGELQISDSTVRLLEQTLGGRHSNTFGVVAGVIVVLSATGLSRALLRAYAAVWSVRVRSSGPAAAGRQIVAVLVLVFCIVGGRMLGGVATGFPAPRVAEAVTTLLTDCFLAALLPWILLGPVVSRYRLLAAGGVFGLMMLGVRAAGAVYLPRALQSSSDRYGTLGLAFTYIGWLYVLSFCLLCSAVLGRALTDTTAGLPGWHWPGRASVAGARETISARRRRSADAGGTAGVADHHAHSSVSPEPSLARDDVPAPPSTQADHEAARRRRDG